ncbi:phage tail tape measure protein [Exiguobacterium sp. USCH10]|uniref:phage tail tape measure protein n=1 Tax=Exiguobacterium sp. USCH10 TaxID=3024839 RepID=UPI0030A31BD1
MASAQVYEIAFKLAGMVDSSMKSSFAKANSGLEQMGEKSKVATGTMKALGAAAVTAGAAIGAVAVGLTGATKSADAFNGAMKQVQASTNMSTKEVAELKKVSTNLYNANLGEDWNDLADAISKTRSVTKLSGKELETATANALIYRDVFGEDVTQSIKAADTMMRNFGISNTEAFNLLAQGAQNGLNKTDELLDTANEYAPYFKALGFSADQMFNVFSAGLENGAFSLDKTADAVKEFNIRSKDGSKASAEAYRALGMDAEKMSQIFAKGGPTAQKSFEQVVAAIAKVKNPVEQNAIAVGLFGTQAEDLEMDVLKAMGSARKQFDMTQKTMEKVADVKYDTIGDAFQGIARQVETGLIIPIGSKALPYLTQFSGYLKGQIPAIQRRMANLGKTIENFTAPLRAAKDMLNGDFVSGRKIMLDVGFDHKQIDAFRDRIVSIKDTFSDVGTSITTALSDIYAQTQPIADKLKAMYGDIFNGLLSFWTNNGPKIADLASGVFQGIGAVVSGIMKVTSTVLSIVQPMIPIIVSTLTGFATKILDFWNENGAQIIQAVQNVFGTIIKIIQFLAPIVLPILKMLWSTISGLINGALDVIMGAIKIFAGLFTGDFSKMWEGVKQLLSGAVEFIWNYMNLMFIGRLITGIKFLGTRLVSSVVSMGRNVKLYFKDMWAYAIDVFQKGKTFGSNTFNALKDAVIGTALKMVNGIRDKFGMMKNRAVAIVGEMKTSISNKFSDIISMAKALPGKMGQGIKNMGGKAVEGAASVGNKLLSKIGNSVNGVIGGLNWVGGKLGIKTKIPTWVVPQYAKGTKGHPGGLAVLGDGRGSNAGPELYRTPNGRVGLSPSTDTLMNLPKGTEVLSATVTRAILANQVPRYAFGTMVGKVTDAFNTGMSWIGDKAGQAKDAAFDVFSYLSNPTELLATMLEKFGIEVPKIDGALGNLAAGAFSSVKDHALTYIKGLVPKMSESLGASFSGSGSTMAKTAISQALAMLNKPMSLLGPLMTIAQKESGFNPNAINDWDINAQRGDPSVGLFQIINSTFQRWKMPGYNNRRNPLDSALAAIRYMDGRYGGIMNHPGIVNMMRGGGYLPYANGGIVTRAHMGLVGEAGPEAIIPLSEEKRGRAMNLLNRVASRFGLELGHRRNPLRDLLDFGSSDAQGGGSSESSTYQFVYSPVVHMAPGSSREDVEDAVKMGYDEFKRMIEQYERERKRNKY